MRQPLVIAAAIVSAFMFGHLSAQNIEPSCDMCPATYVPAEELAEYAFVGRKDGLVDQQVPLRIVAHSKRAEDELLNMTSSPRSTWLRVAVEPS